MKPKRIVPNPCKRPHWKAFFCLTCQSIQRHDVEEPWLHCEGCKRCVSCAKPKSDRCTECSVWDRKNRAADGNISFVRVKPGRLW